MKKYTEYIVEQVQKLLAIDSPTGYTQNVSSLSLIHISACQHTYRPSDQNNTSPSFLTHLRSLLYPFHSDS